MKRERSEAEQAQDEAMLRDNPFSFRSTFGNVVTTCDAAERVKLVRKSTDAGWLERVRDYSNVQKSVKQAAEVRLRALGKRGAA